MFEKLKDIRKAPLLSIPVAGFNSAESLFYLTSYMLSGNKNPYLLKLAIDSGIPALTNFAKPAISYVLPKAFSYLARFPNFKGFADKSVNVTNTALNILDAAGFTYLNHTRPSQSISRSAAPFLDFIVGIYNVAEAHKEMDEGG